MYSIVYRTVVHTYTVYRKQTVDNIVTVQYNFYSK